MENPGGREGLCRLVRLSSILDGMDKHDNTAEPLAVTATGGAVSDAFHDTGEIGERLLTIFAQLLRQQGKQLKSARIREQLAGATDEGALLIFLEHALVEKPDRSAQERVLLRGQLNWQRLLERSGGLLDTAAAARRLGISEDAVRQRQRRGQLIAFKQGGRWRFPAVQFTEMGTLPSLPQVLEALDASVVRQVSFLLSRDEDGETLAEALASGDPRRIERVLQLAEQDGEHGAA